MEKKNKIDTGEKSKDLFISIASHKLFTPITVMKLRLELLLNDVSLPENVRGQLKEVSKSVAELEDLANVLLRVSDILEINEGNMREINIKKLINAVISDFKKAAKPKRIKIKAEYIGSTVIKINFKDSYLRYILSSIIDNSVKYGKERGSVDIKCTVSDKKVEFSITDDGVGIPESEFDMLFDSFFRGTNIQKLDVKGFGLSLYTVKLLLDKIKGKIKCESSGSKGTEFIIELKINS